MKRLLPTGLALVAFVFALLPTPSTALPYVGRTPGNKLTSADLAATDRFGVDVAVSGNLAIVGAYQDDDGGSNTGSAYLFDLTTGVQIRKLAPTDPTANKQFGFTVAITGHLGVVSGFQDSGIGAIYVFDLNTGLQLRKIVPDDGETGDNFGRQLAVSGNLALVGAFQDDDLGSNSGAAYLVDLTTGEQLFKLHASDGNASDFFGSAVALSGNLGIVSASAKEDGAFTPGAVYLFDLSTGTELRKLKPPVPKNSLNYGVTVAISEDRVLVGALGDDRGGVGTFYGAVHVYDPATGSLIRTLGHESPATSDAFGVSIALSGDIALIAASGVSGSTGAAFFFDIETGEQLYRIDPADPSPAMGFAAVAFDGAYAIVGAPELAAGGSAYVFDYLHSQIDVRVGSSPTSAIGDGLYNDTGAGQTLGLVSSRAAAVAGYFNIENDGDEAVVARCAATPGDSQFAVSYYRRFAGTRTNITAALLSGLHVEPNVLPGGDRRVIEILVDPSDSLIKKKRVRRGNGKVVKKTTVLRRTFTARLTADLDGHPAADTAAVSVSTR